ncbi:RHS repeat-associated protein [Chitinophaga polysaccharea]|uniref:RHS repeat-associated protein n=2 Tax=Chitinophaga polysaccharea TaxID=1293035 RepID=A0A561PQZ2_9BACT|nr:RHS repeat-associated protein [Chitinophaga polysaccharea]
MGCRKFNIFCIRAVVSLLLMLSISAVVKAQVESYQQQLHGRFKKGDTLIIKDEKFKNDAYNWSTINNKLVSDIITFGLYKDSVYQPEKPFKCDLDLKIEYWSQPDQEDPITIDHASLKIDFDTAAAAPFQAEQIYTFKNAYKIKLTINNITSKELGDELPPIFMLKGQVIVDRQYTSKKEEALTMSAFFSVADPGTETNSQMRGLATPMAAPAAPLSDKVNVNWNEVVPGQEYDLEWTYIDEESDNGRFITANRATITDAQLEGMFRNNATRITTSQHNYDITLLHSSKYLLLRVRYVLYVDGFREEHPWTYQVKLAGGDVARVLDISWHLPGFNWQFSASYAEEGKKKEVVSYFDGTLRNRQTVTINNSDKKVVLQENVYDEFGRVAANILPTPIDNDVFKYYPNQNLNGAKGVYTYKDVYNNTTGSCVVKPAPMDISAGASRYYSAQNPFLGKDAFTQYVPDAGGYPLSVTAYTNDNTGRVRVQGGVGETMQPNQDESLNHATKYFYGKPMQWELDRLFGPADAGNASHFLKNMTIDPNGQISISYVNSSGKPVATALSGNAPDNVLPLSSKGLASTTDTRILEPESFVFDPQEMKIKGTTTYLCAVPDHNASIKYRIEKLIKRYRENNVDICSNCYYELKINVFDDCNNKIDANTAAIKIGSTASNCNDEGIVENSFTVDLQKAGEYTVTFELALNPDVITAYTDDFIKRNTNLRVEFFYIMAQLRKTDFSGCFSDCSNCEVNLGTKAVFQQKVNQRLTDNKVEVTKNATELNAWSSGLYDALLATCKASQTNCGSGPCDELRKVMRQDVTPGGQYALFDSYGTALEEEINVLSQSFRKVFPPLPSTYTTYKDAKFMKPDGTETSPYDSLFTLKDLVDNWRDEWADKFVFYHPEYCQLQTCEALATYKKWDAKVQSMCLTAADLPKYVGKTYDPADALWLFSADPFTANTQYQSQIGDLATALNIYSSRETPFAGYGFNSKSLSKYVDYLLYCSDSLSNISTGANTGLIARWNNCTPQAQCRVIDREWALYARYYFQLKEKYYQQIADQRCGTMCKIGRPIEVFSNNCPSATDFAIVADTANCSSSEQSVRIINNGQPIRVTTRVVLGFPYYASRGTAVAVFQPGDRQQKICIYSGAPLNVVTVDTVSCAGYTSSSFPPSVIYDTVSCTPAYTLQIDTLLLSFAKTTGQSAVLSSGAPQSARFVIHLTEPFAPGSIVLFNVTIKTVGKTEVRTVTLTGPNAYAYEYFTGFYSGDPMPTVTINWRKCVSRSPLSCSPLYKNKVSRLERIDSKSYPSNGDSLAIDGKLKVTAMIADNCEANADAWIRQLGSTYPSTTLATLRQKLVAVCKNGGDVAHVNGASAATPVATAEGYRSFKDAMLGVLGATSMKMDCNPWILSSPYPYNVKAQTVEQTIDVSNTSICSRLSALQTEYASQGAGKTFWQYLSGKYGAAMTLTQAELDQLVKSCSNCRYLIASTITLPVFLDGDPQAKGCITGTEYNAAMTALSQEPWNGGLDVNHANYETIVTTYLNHRWGFALGYADYLAFSQKITAEGTTAILCNSPVYKSQDIDPFSCMLDMLDGAVVSGRRRYSEYVDSVRQDFRARYVTVCSGAKSIVNLKAMQQQYHFTLYYYDQAGNLVRTVPPEGVDVLDDQRLNSTTTTIPADFTCNYTGPVQNADLTSSLTALNTTLDSKNTSTIEMWIKGRASGASRVITATTGNKYFITTCLSSTYCYVTIHKLDPVGADVSITNTNDIAVPVSAFPTGSWTHLALQGDFAGGPMSLYVNGELMSNDTKAPFSPCEWEMTAGPSGTTITQDLADLKHLRIYNKELTSGDIYANSLEPCMNVAAGQTALTMWARFNVPANGAPGTVGGPNSNVEVRPMPIAPMHRLTTDYAYTSLNQVVSQKSPDAGTSNFWFDYKGRMVGSQNAKQAKSAKYSYTAYDQLGRIIEVGEVLPVYSVPSPGFMGDLDYSYFLTINNGKPDYVETIYDLSTLPIQYGYQEFLRNRVSRTTHYSYNAQGGLVTDDRLYSYDLLGNVKSTWHNNLKIQYGRTDYNYDLVSGKVNTVLYHPDKDDQFYYGYDYDAENRVIAAKSGIASVSADKWTIANPVTDAAYRYYKHGPLARTELGRNSIQGLDYAYTLQGWLKGINGNFLLPGTEMGKDGNTGSPTANFAKDVAGFSLDYFQGDYKPIGVTGTANPFALQWSAQSGDLAGQNLYNGNISHSVLSLKGINSGTPVGYSYRYDQLNRLRTMRQHALTNAATTWGMAQKVDAYAEDITYDGNGNILTYNRNGTGTTVMDQLTYQYPRDTKGQLTSNRLRYFKDGVAAQVYPGIDVFDQHPAAYVQNATGNAAGDYYQYDEIGNIVKDTTGGISDIQWNVFGKISKITKPGVVIEYFYDASGNRSMKVVTAAGVSTYTIYERDAQGNVLATYEQKTGDANITWKEQYLYGSSRLGSWKPNMKLAGTATKDALWTAINNRDYEIINHLGNVLTTVSDNKVASGGLYDATITSAVDYAPFGMQLVGRKMNGSSYRYGFNGKENDNEIKGEGNQIDYGMRIYDPRIGKFLSTDPLSKQYPHYTPYQFAGNTPIQAIDLDGAEEYHFTYIKDKDGNTQLRYLGKNDIVDRVLVGYRSSHSTYNDAPVPVYENRVNQRQLFTVHTTYDEPIDRYGGLDAKQPQEWKNFDVRTFYNSLEDLSSGKNGHRSLADMLGITVAKYNGAIGPENAALPAGGLGNIKGGSRFRVNIYGEGEAAGFADIAVNPRFANGRALSSTFANGSAEQIIINNSPLFEQELSEIGRLSRSGTTITYSAADSPFFSKLSNFLKDKAQLVSEKSQTMLPGTADEFVQKTVQYKMK